MKSIVFFFALALLPFSALASESALTSTWQALSTLGGGGIRICEVACHDWHGHGHETSVALISARNVPPSDNPKEATEDLNLVSASGLAFECSDLAEDKPVITLDATKFKVPETLMEESEREAIFRSALECLRRVTKDAVFKKTTLVLKAGDAEKAWMEKIVAQYNKHERGKVFYKPEE